MQAFGVEHAWVGAVICRAGGEVGLHRLQVVCATVRQIAHVRTLTARIKKRHRHGTHAAVQYAVTRGSLAFSDLVRR